MSRNSLVIGLLVLFASGCAASRTLPGNVTQAIRNPEAMRATLSSQVIGCPLADAQKFMEQEGFACSVVRRGSFHYGLSDEGEVRQGIDYLHCRRNDPDPESLLVSWGWNVALVLEDDVIVDVLARVFGDGP